VSAAAQRLHVADETGTPLWPRTRAVPIVARIAVFALLVSGCTFTRPFTDAAGRVLPESIASMEMLAIGGVRQSVWFRGRDRRAPALILLHGGPGASQSALFRHFNAALEDHFLVVYWEQRGAGRSYHRGVRRESMSIARMERDLDELVNLVRTRFGSERIVLLGHSWGTILGTRYAHRYPEKVALYVGVGQITDFAERERVSLDWALNQAETRGDERAAVKLRAIAPAPKSVSEELELGRWVERLGGSLRGGLTTRALIRAALSTDETSLVDLWKFGAGNRFSLNALRPEYSHVDLTHVREFAVPILFVLGRHDWHVPSVLGATYFETITAPCKRLVWFEESAHNPPFEQPAEFLRVMIEEVLPLARGGYSAHLLEQSRGAQPACRSAAQPNDYCVHPGKRYQSAPAATHFEKGSHDQSSC
jgi:proline iminopeptidase